MTGQDTAAGPLLSERVHRTSALAKRRAREPRRRPPKAKTADPPAAGIGNEIVQLCTGQRVNDLLLSLIGQEPIDACAILLSVAGTPNSTANDDDGSCSDRRRCFVWFPVATHFAISEEVDVDAAAVVEL